MSDDERGVTVHPAFELVPPPPAPLSSGVLDVLVVDDHEVAREGLQAALAKDSGMRVVALAEDAATAIQIVTRQQVDLAIVDLHLPDQPGEELCERIRGIRPHCTVIILSSYLDEERVRRSLEAGASGYVTKSAGLGELRRLIASLRDATAHEAARPNVSQTVRHLDELIASRSGEDGPSPQQLRILERLVDGMTYPEIAQSLFISISTVRYHVQNLKVKLGSPTRTQLIVDALARGYVARPQDER